MATDRYGINDLSLLSGENAGTARDIQNSFTRSMLAKNRYMERYSLPQLSSFANDNALQQAQTTAGILNNNQQLQHVLDAMNRSPHGVGENLAAYLPMLTSAMRLAPALFGTDSSLTKNGLFGSAYNTAKSWFTDPQTGQNYTITPSGQVQWENYAGMTTDVAPLGGAAAAMPPANWGAGLGATDYWGSGAWGSDVANTGFDWGAGAWDAGSGTDWGSVVGDIYGGL